MLADARPLAEITSEAIQLLYREIGVANTTRFIRQFTSGYGNYTEERRELIDDLELDDLIAEIKARRVDV